MFSCIYEKLHLVSYRFRFSELFSLSMTQYRSKPSLDKLYINVCLYIGSCLSIFEVLPEVIKQYVIYCVCRYMSA